MEKREGHSGETPVWRLSDGRVLDPDAWELLSGCEAANATASAFLWLAAGPAEAVALPCEAAAHAALASQRVHGLDDEARLSGARRILDAWAQAAASGRPHVPDVPSKDGGLEELGIAPLAWPSLCDGGEEAVKAAASSLAVEGEDGSRRAPARLVRALAASLVEEDAQGRMNPLARAAEECGREAACSRAQGGGGLPLDGLSRRIAERVLNVGNVAEAHPALAACPQLLEAVSKAAALMLLPRGAEAALRERNANLRSGAPKRGVLGRLDDLREGGR